MTRTEAIAIIVENELVNLKKNDRESLLLDWWSIDEGDKEFGDLPELLRKEMKIKDEPDGIHKLQYNELLRVALRHRFIGVRNEYLSGRLVMLGFKSETLDGDVEILEECPCCGFLTLSDRGNYEICSVCFWEDDGTQDIDLISGPNHMTLRDGRQNFEQIGAVNEEALKHVLVDGKARYLRK